MRKIPSDPAKAREIVVNIAKILWHDADRLIALRCLMETGDDPAKMRPIMDAGHSDIGLLLKGVVVEALVMRCARACDAGDTELHSIPTAKLLLENTKTRAAVAARGDDAAIGHFVRLADEIARNYSHGRVRAFRNYHLAHHLPRKFKATEKASFNHLRNAVDDVIRTIAQLAYGTGIHRLSAEGQEKIWRPRCNALWTQLAAPS